MSLTFDDTVKELILRRRRQLLVHSCIYYRFGTSIIDDAQFDSWSYELVALQQSYPAFANEVEFAKEFKEFDGTTGFDLPQYGWIISKAQQLLNYHNKEGKQ
jgi:NAD-dependent DNA ligase